MFLFKLVFFYKWVEFLNLDCWNFLIVIFEVMFGFNINVVECFLVCVLRLIVVLFLFCINVFFLELEKRRVGWRFDKNDFCVLDDLLGELNIKFLLVLEYGGFVFYFMFVFFNFCLLVLEVLDLKLIFIGRVFFIVDELINFKFFFDVFDLIDFRWLCCVFKLYRLVCILVSCGWSSELI